MAAVEVTITGMLYDKLARTTQNVVLIGEATLTGLGIGGGPIIPPGQPPGGPDHIWGGGNVPMPSPPIAGVPGAPGYRPPGIWGGPIDPYPGHPLPEPPPITQPPEGIEIPPPGSPPVVLPGTHPVSPVVPPPAIVVSYPGIGPVLIPQPLPPT